MNVYTTISVLTFGLPQTRRHLCSLVINLDNNKDKYNSSIDIAEIVATEGIITGQLLLMEAFYSRLLYH